ncbi:hypothetical protein [Enterocloster sp.]|uniref:hypothetical protein n=1 Tax=Enterocloster sp. TaxID=2719315 RepID=UPI0039A39534
MKEIRQGREPYLSEGDNMLNLNYEPDVLVEDITTLSHDEWKLYRTLGIGVNGGRVHLAMENSQGFI